MSRRESLLSMIGGIVIVAVLYLFFVYQPKQREFAQLTAQLKDLRSQVERMERTVREAEQLEKEFAALQGFIATVEAKLPAQKEIPELLVRLERLTTSLGINLQAIKPAPLEAVTEAGAAAPPGTPPRPAPAAPAPAATAAYFRFPIKLTVLASYEEFLKLTSSLHDFPRLMVVRRLTVIPKQVPDLTAELDVETFVLPREAR